MPCLDEWKPIRVGTTRFLSMDIQSIGPQCQQTKMDRDPCQSSRSPTRGVLCTPYNYWYPYNRVILSCAMTVFFCGTAAALLVCIVLRIYSP